MKSVILVGVVTLISLGQAIPVPQNQGPQGHHQQPHHDENRRPRVYEVRSQIFHNDGKGNFKYEVETSDGLQATQEGHLKNQPTLSEFQGTYTTFDDAGNIVKVNYVADDKGFQVDPASLPIPEELVKAQQDAARVFEETVRQHKQIRDEHEALRQAAKAAAETREAQRQHDHQRQ